MYPFVCYGFLGVFIGTMVGMSADSVVKTLIPIVFAFAGGSVVALREKFDRDKLGFALNALLGVGLGGLIGIYSAILINEHRLLTPFAQRHADFQRMEKHKDGKYLRSEQGAIIAEIAQRLRAGTITVTDAAAKLEALEAEARRVEK